MEFPMWSQKEGQYQLAPVGPSLGPVGPVGPVGPIILIISLLQHGFSFKIKSLGKL